MQAFVHTQYGAPKDSLVLMTVPKPVPKNNEVLIRIKAIGLNAADYHCIRGDPYLMRLMLGTSKPKKGAIMGTALSGVVEEMGKAAIGMFAVGDKVMVEPGISYFGAFAEYVAVNMKSLVRVPEGCSFEEAAGMPVSATTAYCALQCAGAMDGTNKVQSLLVVGASGGVGTAVVQIAKAVGIPEVSAVCSGRNFDLVSSLGADVLIDYTKEDYTKKTKLYDAIVDLVSTASVNENCNVIQKNGVYVPTGSLGSGDVVGKIWYHAGAAMNPFSKRKVALATNDGSGKTLEKVKSLYEEGKFKVPIEKTFKFEELVLAMDHLETGRTRGKVIVLGS